MTADTPGEPQFATPPRSHSNARAARMRRQLAVGASQEAATGTAETVRSIVHCPMTRVPT